MTSIMPPRLDNSASDQNVLVVLYGGVVLVFDRCLLGLLRRSGVMASTGGRDRAGEAGAHFAVWAETKMSLAVLLLMEGDGSCSGVFSWESSDMGRN
ncbi:hypothetical protein V8C44DRAFT_336956 [Trichoderma aethiopicum]